ncbi:MAG: OmpA family protein [Gemmatimonadota bacterium]|nr:OmpA family protein [Gemmatimonadota bacterium]
MTRRTLGISLVISAAALTACRRTPATTPTPASVGAVTESTGPTAAEVLAGRRADSIAAANRAAAANANSADAERAAATLKNMLQQPVYFDYDKDQIRDDARVILDAKAAILAANPSVTYVIVGHTDEQGTAEYNLALGQRRAAQVKRYLVSKGVDEGRFATQSLGDSQPAARGTDEASYQLNRRAEFQSSNMPGALVRPRS